MSTHNIGFYEEISEIIFQISSNRHLNSSSTALTAEVHKLNVVAQKRNGRPKKTWDELLMNDRKQLGMDSADPQNCSEWRGRLRRRLVRQAPNQ